GTGQARPGQGGCGGYGVAQVGGAGRQARRRERGLGQALELARGSRAASARAHPRINWATAALRSASETVRPCPPAGRAIMPEGFSTRIGGVPEMASAPNSPSRVGPLMSEMIAGGAFQAIQGSRKKLEADSRRLFMAVNSACWCSVRCRSVWLG